MDRIIHFYKLTYEQGELNRVKLYNSLPIQVGIKHTETQNNATKTIDSSDLSQRPRASYNLTVS